MTKINRNDPCPCGSGKKYKKCCGITASHGRKFTVGGPLSAVMKSAPQAAPALSMAKKVFKVLTSTSPKPGETHQKNPVESGTPRSYGTLEELIGIEGAPQKEPTPEGQ